LSRVVDHEVYRSSLIVLGATDEKKQHEEEYTLCPIKNGLHFRLPVHLLVKTKID
jgi:hypothetical protein